MIKFEEELKNFKPSLEIEQSADVIYQQDFTDMADVVIELMKDDKKGTRKDSKSV